MAEETIWEGKSSQIVNLGAFIFCTLTCILIIPIFIGLWKWLTVKCRTYKITTERLHIQQGVLSRRSDELELYRVKDITFVQPFFLRLFGLGSLILATSDRSTPYVHIQAIKNANELKRKIRDLVEKLRTAKGVKEVDFE